MPGCGGIAGGTYWPYPNRFPNVEVVAVCDILMDTVAIQARYGINMLALSTGKHPYSQKPVGLTVDPD